MPQTTSAKKALRVSERRRKRNIVVKDSYRAARKAVRDAVSAGKVKDAEAKLPEAHSKIDFAAKKGVLHANTASRYKSRLSSLVKNAQSK
ncbi:MAG: 30S ribosomal protein S20 [Candidatus Dojkabacteria bacterium]